VQKQIQEKMKDVIQHTAKTFDAEAELTYMHLAPPTINDEAMAELVRQSATQILGKDAITDMALTMAGEDFSYFMEEAPGAIAFLGTGNPECGAIYANHNGHFCVDESVLIKGAMLYAQVAMAFNEN
jgi:metal-dependent amidase/aminoacylase/carboxypeptidase family protein